MRAGQFVRQIEGYTAFIPAPLPPDPPPALDGETIKLLSQADWALGRLDGVTSILPNPDLFVAMFVRQEAVLSSQIEGTQSTLEDVLQFEAETGADVPKDIGDVVNYVAAMNYGLTRLNELPLCLRLIREIHERLLRGARGGEKTPGEFRRTQNWIGPPGCSLATALFVPPPFHAMHAALADLERFLHDTLAFPVLVHCALAHAQFETIHPFIDGNGRIGRLLITFLLCQREILHHPLLYLSSYLKAHRSEYYDRLTAIRLSGDWEGWIRFFLRGVFEVSQAASATARKILELREQASAAGEAPGSSRLSVRAACSLDQHGPIAARLRAPDRREVRRTVREGRHPSGDDRLSSEPAVPVRPVSVAVRVARRFALFAPPRQRHFRARRFAEDRDG